MDLEGLSLVCAGLGSIEEDDTGNKIGYTKAPHCLENLKDLIRFLRRDDPETRQVFKQVSKWNIVGKDLVPIIEHYQDDFNLVLNAVKVLVFLAIPIDHSSSEISQQIEYLWDLKSAITNSHVIPVVVSVLEKPLCNLESEVFSEEDWKLVQLVLTLFRHLLAIQDITLHQKLGGSAPHILHLRDKFLKILFDENVMDIIIVLTQYVEDSRGFLRQDSLLLLETLHYILLGQDPEMVANADKMCSQAGPGAHTSLESLKLILHDEKKKKASRIRTLGRHSQFTGTFTRYTMDGSKSLRAGTPTLTSHDGQLKQSMNKTTRGLSKRHARDHNILPSTDHHILRCLHDFVKQFLKGGYNVLMESVRVDIEKEHHAVDNSDILVFFQVTEFFTSFQYHKLLIAKLSEGGKPYDGSFKVDSDSTLLIGEICGTIASSMNESMFLLVISRWRQAFEGLKDANNYKLLSATGSVMKTLIRLLDTIFKLSPDSSREGHTARILLYKLFYDQTDQGMAQFVLCLLKSFEINKQPKSDLSDLVEMIHVIIRVLEKLQADGTLRVSKKARKARSNKLKNSEKADDRLNGEDNVDGEMNFFSNDQYAKVKDFNNEDTRECHIKGDESATESPATKEMNGEIQVLHDDQDNQTNDDYHILQPSESSNEEEQVATTEVDFKISTLVSSFANEHIIHNICWLLSFYKNNSAKTNYYIVGMLKRLCEDLELSPMLYQLSFLTTFYKILSEQKLCPIKDHENIVEFLTTLIRRMLRRMKSQPLLFLEILFWKTRRECKYISCNSIFDDLSQFRDGASNLGSAHGNGQSGQKGLRRSIADALGDDEADFVMSHNEYNEAGNDAKSDSATVHEREGNVNSWDGNTQQEAEKLSKRKKRLVLNSEMEERIKNLYNRYKKDPLCTKLIANAMDSDGKISSLQVSYKLKQLGLALPSKKRSRNETFDKSTDQEIGAVKETHPTGFSNDGCESTTLGKEMPNKKRVQATTKDQEENIKFKGQHKCSYMIASALDSAGTLKASQLSRKHKQLGLPTLNVHQSSKNAHLDNDGSDANQISDDETFISLSMKNRKRKKSKQIENNDPEMMNGGELVDESSDNKLLIKKQRKKLHKSRKGNLTTSSSVQSAAEGELENEVQVTEMNGSEQILYAEAVTCSTSGSGDTTDTVMNPVELESQKVILSETHVELLEDSEDDAAPVLVAFAENNGPEPSRRKRLVVDSEDDD